MLVKTLKPSYLYNLREQAKKAYADMMTLEANKAKDLLINAECDHKVFVARPPTDNSSMSNWFAGLEEYQKKIEQLKAIYEVHQQKLTDGNSYFTAEAMIFVCKYESKHYAPKEEDYDEVEVDDVKVCHGSEIMDVEV